MRLQFGEKCVLAILAVAGIVQQSNAAINVQGYWHLGEADGGATSPNAVITTVDSSGNGNTLTSVGSPKYSSDVSAVATAKTGSTLSVDFAATGANYLTSAAPVSTATDNFGMEGWFKISNTEDNIALAYNGNAAADGWGLYVLDGFYAVLYGGNEIFTTDIAPSQDVWTYLAFVRDNGVTTFFVDSAAPIATTPVINFVSYPNTPTGPMTIGDNSVANGPLEGLADEVRVFTFASGAFSTDDLLISLPEPSSAGLLLASSFLLARRTRRVVCRKV